MKHKLLLSSLLIAALTYVACKGRVIFIDKKTDTVEYTIERTRDIKYSAQADTESDEIEYKGHNISIFDLYKFACRSTTNDFIIRDELNYIISQINPGYDVEFSGKNTVENFETFRNDLDSIFELKTEWVHLDTVVLAISKIEETDRIKTINSARKNTVNRTNFQTTLHGVFRAEEISNYIKEITGLPVKMDSIAETGNNYEIDSLSIPKKLPLDDLIAWLKTNGVYVEKQKERKTFLKISNLYSNDSVFRYTPRQLENDASMFFSLVEKNHPDPYFRHGKEAFEQKKRQIFEQLQESRTSEEFIKIMNLINPCLDPHTQLFNNYIHIQAENGIMLAKETEEKIFPDVIYKDRKIFSTIDSEEVEILSINGYKTKDMLDSIKYYWVLWAPNFEKLLMEHTFPLLLPAYFDIHAPFTLGLKSGTKIIDGISLADASGYKDSLEEEKKRENPISFTVYPQSSLAVLYVRTFAENFIHPDSLELKMRILNDSLKRCDVKTLFIDLSKNTGGDVLIVGKFFDYFQHDTLFCRHKWKGKLPDDCIEMFPNNIAGYPQKDKSLFGGNIFILQGTRTYSGGDVFCRVMAENKLGVRFGQETSQYGKTWLPAQIRGLSYVNLSFSCAFGFWEFEGFDDGLLQPDMYWDVDNTYEFSEKELNSMITSYQNSIR
ncbi:MAG: hypothetical protein LBL13_09425 [Bacteroidales bacterium]|jgi:hypothetical protein|nr:hypothetical protein [Bacteroidales bacterium]